MHLERADGRDHHAGRRLQPRNAALDIEEFLRAQICAEPCLRDDVIAQFERGARRNDGVATVRDVRERSAVHDRGRALERLHEIGFHCVLEERAHRARRLEIARRDGLALCIIPDDDAGKARL